MKNPHEHNKHGDFSFPIIPYQAITGNNNVELKTSRPGVIIPYQAITGNNNLKYHEGYFQTIIPYQAITGNNNILFL